MPGHDLMWGVILFVAAFAAGVELSGWWHSR